MTNQHSNSILEPSKTPWLAAGRGLWPSPLRLVLSFATGRTRTKTSNRTKGFKATKQAACLSNFKQKKRFWIVGFSLHDRNSYLLFLFQIVRVVIFQASISGSVTWWSKSCYLHSIIRVRVTTCISCKSLKQSGFYLLI